MTKKSGESVKKTTKAKKVTTIKKPLDYKNNPGMSDEYKELITELIIDDPEFMRQLYEGPKAREDGKTKGISFPYAYKKHKGYYSLTGMNLILLTKLVRMANKDIEGTTEPKGKQSVNNLINMMIESYWLQHSKEYLQKNKD